MNTIKYKELDFGFSISGCWSGYEFEDPNDAEEVAQWQTETNDLLCLANKEKFLVCWGEGNTLDAVIGYNPERIIDIMGKIQTQFGDIQATIYGYGESWDIDTLDNPDETFFDDILPEIMENQDIMIIVNGYKIRYNPHFLEFQVSHDDIGANLECNPNLEVCVEYSKKG